MTLNSELVDIMNTLQNTESSLIDLPLSLKSDSLTVIEKVNENNSLSSVK